MFREWLKNNRVAETDLGGCLFPRASDRAFWDKIDGEIYIRRAEQLADYDWPTILATDYMAYSRTGDRDIMENKHFSRRRAFYALIVAELCEGKGRFLDQIINGIMAISEETFWGVSAHYIKDIRMIPDARDPYIDLFAAETGAAMAICRYLFGEQLEALVPEITARLDDELDRRIVKPFLTHEDFWWMGLVPDTRRVNNWNPWILSNITTVALLATPDAGTRVRIIEKVLYVLDSYMATVPSDGGCDEGITYWNVSAGAVFDVLFQLHLASRGVIDFFSEPLIYRMGDYACKAYIGDGRVVNLADGSNRVDLPGFGYGMIYNFGEKTHNERLMGLGYLFSGLRGNENALRRILIALVYPPRPTEFTPYGEAVLDALQVSFVRSKTFFGAVKGGHNSENHNHNDVGSFLVFSADHKPIFIDAGVGVYTKETFSENRYNIWSMQSSWHNLPDLNGVAQRNGTSYRAATFSYEGGMTTVDFAPAYPREACVRAAVRTFAVRDEEVRVTDAYTFEGETNTVASHFLVTEEPRVSDGCVEIGDYVLSYAGQEMTCTVEEKDISYDARLHGTWRQDSLWRLTLTATTGREATLTFVLKRR